MSRSVHASISNSRFLQAAQRSSQEIFCLDNAFALIDGTKRTGQVNGTRENLGYFGLTRPFPKTSSPFGSRAHTT